MFAQCRLCISKFARHFFHLEEITMTTKTYNQITDTVIIVLTLFMALMSLGIMIGAMIYQLPFFFVAAGVIYVTLAVSGALQIERAE